MVLKSNDNKDIIITCNCGCGEAVRIKREVEDNEVFISFLQDYFYTEQYGYFDILQKKLSKIWKIIRNKDVHILDLVVTNDDIKKLSKYLRKK